jgi:hypothetical protein
MYKGRLFIFRYVFNLEHANAVKVHVLVTICELLIGCLEPH